MAREEANTEASGRQEDQMPSHRFGRHPRVDEKKKKAKTDNTESPCENDHAKGDTNKKQETKEHGCSRCRFAKNGCDKCDPVKRAAKMAKRKAALEAKKAASKAKKEKAKMEKKAASRAKKDKAKLEKAKAAKKKPPKPKKT